MQKLEFHFDAGHGWLRVSKKLFIEVMGKKCNSGYSYEDKNNYYLEEDCDAPEFLNAYLGHYSKKWDEVIIEIDDGDDSFIRNLENVKA